ncbi:MAG: hypothetical protein QXL89_01705 [Nitrososphaeria archaeon]
MTGSHFITLNEDEFINEALNIVSKAEEKGIILRILGSLAVRLYVSDNPQALLLHRKRLNVPEQVFTDLDLIGYGKQRGSIEKFFSDLQYQPDRIVNRIFGDRRLIFYHPKGYFIVDVFLNKLEFSHDVYFGEKPGKGRLELSYPAITPTDLVLEKLQIHKINKKDLIDLAALFLVKDVNSDPLSIDGLYIAKILSQDWGFWYDATNNLNKLKYIVKELLDLKELQEEVCSKIIQKVDSLLSIIDKEPKSKDWIKRSQIGTKKPWYREVEESF